MKNHMTNEELEDMENVLASHLKPVREGERRWFKAIEFIKNTINSKVEAALNEEADSRRRAIERAYAAGFAAGQGQKV